VKKLDREKIAECIAGLRVLIDDWTKVETREIEEQAERLIIAKSAELVKFAESNNSEMACNCYGECDEDDFDDEDDGIAHACIRTAQIKSIDFSEDGVTKINMRHGEPIIFKDISEVMFIS